MLLDRTTSRRKRETLVRIWSALEAIRTGGDRSTRPQKYTVAAVRRRLAAAGTPIGESTILNRGQGDDYRALIRAYEDEYGSTRSDVTGDDTLALEIADPRLQARIRLVLQQNRALQHRVDILHRDYNRLVADAARGATPASQTTPPPAADITPREIRAVRRFLERIADHRWQVDEPTGAILDRRGDEIAEPGFVFALRRITAR